MTELQQAEARIARLIEDLGQSFQAEIGGLREEMREGFDRIDATTKRTMGLVAADAVALGALKKWAGTQDVREKRRDTEIRDLRLRVRKLEQKAAKKGK